MATYEEILQKMLDIVDDKYDKREGSVIYDALAPCAVAINQYMIDSENMQQEAFADTATREYLLRICKDRGITPYEASKAICTAVFTGIEPDIGTRFTGGSTTYVYLGDNLVECETAGTIGNEYQGNIIPIEYVSGLLSAKITAVVVYGEDEESTEALRERYYESLDEKAFGGNIADYKSKTLAIDGVGALKVTAAWNGAGTVKLTILSSNFEKASSELINIVQEAFDPNQDGKGDGLAPIGHIVTVDTPQEVAINIKSTLTYATGQSWDALGSKITKAVNAYLESLRKQWADNDLLIVRIAMIEAAILSVDGVLDVTNTTINDGTSNIEIGFYEIPILGDIECTNS